MGIDCKLFLHENLLKFLNRKSETEKRICDLKKKNNGENKKI